jgi:predicted AlkP superfamily pyrophosphatase or phosphodiesterase
MKKTLLVFSLIVFFIFSQAQKVSRPKLVVGIMVDQMRWDFLYRYADRYTADGFKRILREGFSNENTFIPYTPTYTAPGHTCVYTGSVPALHGIAGNYWYDKALKRNVYCTEDSTVNTVGSTSTAGKHSPRNMWANTITDELRMAQNFRNKTIAIALKDRGAILPGGHTSNGSYWFDNANGSWISSDFFMKSLPQWMIDFNNKKWPDQYLKQNWKTLYPLNTYINSTADDKPYESNLPGEDRVFDHETEKIVNNKYETFRYTPFANTYTFQTAKAAIEGEKLGSGSFTDFLAISFSSPDYIGHAFGPNSIEIEDMYLRLDRDMADFLKYLDAKIGKGQYLLFLTADHGVAHIPGFAKENKIPAGAIDDAEIRKAINERVQKRFNISNTVEAIINYQLYLNNSVITPANRSEIREFIKQELLTFPSITAAFDLDNVAIAPVPDKIRSMAVNGYNQKRSGDIQFTFNPQWFDGWQTGTTHGVWNPYDSHIPLLWFGWNIKQGKSNKEVYMTDIAPTLAALLKIQMPNATIGKVIEEVASPNPSGRGASQQH